jgi:hypothetical protein
MSVEKEILVGMGILPEVQAGIGNTYVFIYTYVTVLVEVMCLIRIDT